MSKEQKKQESFSGKVVRKPLVIGSSKKTEKTIQVGRTFTTTNEAVYKSLIKNRRIK